MNVNAKSPDVVTAPYFSTNPEIFKLGQTKQHVLAHEIGAGSPCRNCDCVGLDLHFWRKMCKTCGCRMDEHDVQLPNQYDHGQIIIGRLFHIRERFDNIAEIYDKVKAKDSDLLRKNTELSYAVPNKQRDENRALPTAAYNFKIELGDEHSITTEYTWVPVPDSELVDKYMRALPLDDRPIVGTEGEKKRKCRLQYQLPLYDCNIEDSRFVCEEDKEVLSKFVENVKKNVIGVGHIVEVNEKVKEPPITDCVASKNSETASSFEVDAKRSQYKDLVGMDLGTMNCKSCRNIIEVGEVGIKSYHGCKEDIWHPNCFRCLECNQLLVDMLYFYLQGKYYCGRHFADQQYPRCAGCDELIFAREYTFAEDKSWHFDHFACFKCDFKLGGHRYMTTDDNPHCIECYMKYLAKICDFCQKKIGPDEKRLNYQDVHWHAKQDCFHCQQCKLNLIGKKFIFKEHNLFCSSQCKSEFKSNSAYIIPCSKEK